MTHLPKLLNPLFMEQVLASQFPSADDMGTAIEAVATAVTKSKRATQSKVTISCFFS